ncbi:MAG: hypothetical protein QY331_03160 [Melioribacteraceae bacterium]|nr:hypothetical protein [Melioribacteraceae bacterium]WKZ70255.1 MAG: hypothetical protein QY331_03160 [Melioribacteraceae bacterium]
MKKILIAAVMFTTLVVTAQNLNGRFSTSLYTFERFSAPEVSELNVRSLSSLYFNLSKDNITLRSRLNFETNIANSLNNDPRLRFYNLYVEARNLLNVATIRLGRQSLYNGVAGGLYDGVNLQLRHGIFKLEGFYGGNVPEYQKLELTDDFANDFILGGELTVYPTDELRIAVNYTDKNFKAQDYDAIRLNEFNVLDTILIQRASNQFKYLGAEVSYYIPKLIEINSRYNYDLNFEQTSRFEIGTRYTQVEDFGVSLYYNYREPRIRYNSIFSVFNFSNTEEIEGGLDYKFSDVVTAFGKFANVTYQDEDSQRLTLGVNTTYGTVSYRTSFGYAGELNSFSVYTARSFDDGFITPSFGLTVSSYRLSENDPKNNLLALLAGINIRPWSKLSFDLQTQYVSNKIYNNDFRILFKINHWFNTNF